MATVTIKNPQKEVFLFTLYHSVYCANEISCGCQKQKILRSVPGGMKYTDIVNPKSVHLEGGKQVTLDASALKIQQVASALKSGRLQQVKVEATSDKGKKE